jgi:hypothetical protein
LNAVVTPEEDNNSPYVQLDVSTFDSAEVIDCEDEHCNIGDSGDNNTSKKHDSGFTKMEVPLVCKVFIAPTEDSQTAMYQKLGAFKQKLFNCLYNFWRNKNAWIVFVLMVLLLKIYY